jgi:hypothetical protein
MRISRVPGPVGPQTLFLHEKQMEVFRDRHRFKVVVAGRRWGKTQLAKISMITAAQVRNQLIWYVAPSYRMAKQIMWPELLMSTPRRWIKRINETSMSIWLVNGTLLELKGADNPDSLRGVGLHYLIMDEVQDIAEHAWFKVLRPTLASTGGGAMFIGTPKSYNVLHKLYTFGKRGEKYTDEKGFVRQNQWASWQFPTITSPFIPVSEIEEARADMDERSFRQEFEASFETMSGRVYYPFDRKVHVGKFEFNPALPIWVGQDFNIDPMSSFIAQPQDNNDVLVVDEISLKGSTEDVVNELERRYWKQAKNVIIFPDPAAGYRQHARGETDLDIFRERGFKRLRYHKRHPAISDRVNAVNRMFMSAEGKIRMRVDEKCKHVIESAEQTVYKEGSREVDKKAQIEHMMDGGGYCIEFQFPVHKIQTIGVSI